MSTVLRGETYESAGNHQERVIGFIVPPRAWSSGASWRASLPLDAAHLFNPIESLLRFLRFGCACDRSHSLNAEVFR